MIDLNGIKLKNRFLIASGAMEYGRGWPWERPLIRSGLIDLSVFGGVITKTLTPEPRAGNYIDPFEFEERSILSHLRHMPGDERKRVLRKIPGGWLNNMGWWGIGIDYWIKEIYPKLQNVAIIPNIGGFSIAHYLELIKKLNPLDIVAIELDIFCPNVEHSFVDSPSELVELFTLCQVASRHPLIVKLGVDCDYLKVARIAEDCGINAISAINSVSVFGGGYSGSGIKYIALKVVSDLKKEISLPVIGGGGITSWKDCQDFFQKAKADAVSFGTVFLSPTRFWLPTWIAKKYCKETEKFN